MSKTNKTKYFYIWFHRLSFLLLFGVFTFFFKIIIAWNYYLGFLDIVIYSMFAAFPAAFIVSILVYILIYKIKLIPLQKKYKILVTKVLETEIDPEKFIKEFEPFMEMIQEKGYSEDDKFRKMWLVVAYISNGNLDKALEILNDTNVNLDFNKTKDSIFWVSYNHCLCDIYLLKNDFENAEKHYDIMKSYYDIFKSNPRNAHKKTVLKDFDDWVFELDTRLYPSKDKYQKVLAYYEKLMNNEKTSLRGKVNLKFKMAIAYENLGMEEERKKCLEYVAANGNKHYRVKLAKEMLAKLNETNVE